MKGLAVRGPPLALAGHNATSDARSLDDCTKLSRETMTSADSLPGQLGEHGSLADSSRSTCQPLCEVGMHWQNDDRASLLRFDPQQPRVHANTFPTKVGHESPVDSATLPLAAPPALFASQPFSQVSPEEINHFGNHLSGLCCSQFLSGELELLRSPIPRISVTRSSSMEPRTKREIDKRDENAVRTPCALARPSRGASFA